MLPCPLKFSSLFYCNGHVRKSKEQLIRSIILMHGHSRNQSGVTLASKALDEQGNRAVRADFQRGENAGRSRVFFFFPFKWHNLERTTIKKSNGKLLAYSSVWFLTYDNVLCSEGKKKKKRNASDSSSDHSDYDLTDREKPKWWLCGQ